MRTFTEALRTDSKESTITETTAPPDDEAPAVTAAPSDIVVLNEQMAAMQQQFQSISDVVIGMATTAVAPPTSCDVTRQLRRHAADAGSAATAVLDCVDNVCVLGENHDKPFPSVMQ